MAVTNEQKIDFLLKKIGYTKTKTGSVVGTGAISGTPKQPFAEAIPSPLIIANGALWNEADSIPATPPGADTTQVKVYLAATSGLRMTADATSSGQRAYIAYSTYGNTSSTRLTNWIDTQFGASYIIKVYRGDPNSGGVNLSAAGSGQNDGWFFDYSAGVLNFNDSNVPSGVTDTNIYIVGYRYIGQTGAPTSGISTFSYLDLTVERNLDVGIQGGISTFRNNIDLNADLDVDGHTNLDNVSIAGVSTFASAIDLNADLDVDGHTNLDNVSIAGVVTATTFVGNGDFVELDVDGHTNLDNVSVAGVSTFAGAIDLNADLDVDGHTNLDNVSIAGVTTFTGAIDANGDLDVDGHANLDNVSIAGVTTTAGLLDINAGGQANTFKVEDLTSGRIVLAGTGGELEDSNKLTFNGTTFGVTGDASFTGNVSIGGTLTYEDVQNIDAVGLITARSGIRVTGGVIEALAGENKIPSLYSNMGALPSAGSYHGMFAHVHATGRGYFAHAGNWYELVNKEVNGVVGTGTERYNVGPIDAVDINVSSSSTTKSLNVTGVTTAITVDINGDLDVDGHTNLDNINVAGVSTFAGAIDLNADLDVDGHLNVDNVSIAGVTTLTGAVTANGAIDLNADLDVDGHTNLDNVSIAGVSTFASAIDLNADLDVDGHTNLDNVNVSGVTTFAGTVNTASIVATGIDLNGDIDVDGHTNLDNVSVAGVSTFTGAIDANGDLDVDGHTNLDNVSIAGVTTTSGLLDINAGGQANTFKVEDLTSGRVVLAGTGGELEDNNNLRFDGTDLYVSGIRVGSGNGGIIGDDIITRNLKVNGISTHVGIATFNDATFHGDIDVDGHTNLDNVSVAGVTTFADNVKAVFGNGGDLEIFHRSADNNSIIKESGSGVLSLETNGSNISLYDTANSRTMAQFNTGGSITLNHGATTRLETTNTGINVIGLTDTDTLLSSGNATFGGSITAGGATGNNGQYLKTTGSGVEWATFPSLRTRQTFTASSGQTTFSFNYTVSFLDVFVNGIKLTDAEFTATNGSSVVLAVGCFVGDIVELVSYNTVSAGGGAGGISNIVEDTTPQLGGNLDLFNKSITGTGNVNITGIITATNFVGDGSGLTNVIGSGSGVVIKNSGSVVGTAGTIDFGDNLSVTPISAGIVTITGSASGGSGISTISGVVNIVNDLDVDGHTNLDNVNIAGVTTFGNNIFASGTSRFEIASMENALLDGSIEHTGDTDTKLQFGTDTIDLHTGGSTRVAITNTGVSIPQDLDVDGHTNLDNVSIAGFTTITQDLDVNGHTELDNVNIAGVVTATTFKGALQGTSGTFSSGVDITGDLDVDGHTNLDNVSVAGVVTATTFVGALSGNASSATVLQNARTIGGVSFDGSANINLPGVNAAGNQDTTGNAATFTVTTNNVTDETVYPVFVDGTSGSQGAEIDTSLTYNPSSGNLTSDSFTGQSFVQVGSAVTLSSSGNATYTGIITAQKFVGDGSGLTGITASGSGVVIKHDGSTVGTAGTINFSTNLDVSAISAGIVTVTASGGAAGLSTDAQENTIGGANAGANLDVSGQSGNTLIGFKAGEDISSGDFNTAIGHQALLNTTTSSNNTAIGRDAGRNNFQGNGTVFAGYAAGYDNQNGNYNIGVGWRASQGIFASPANYKIGIGYYALRYSKGDYNIAIGHQAGYSSGSFNEGTHNITIGASSGKLLSTGSDNTIMGGDAGDALTTGSNNLILGHDAAASSNSVSNEITLGDTNITKFRVPGINVVLKDNGGTPTQGHVLTVDANGEAGFAAASGGGSSNVGITTNLSGSFTASAGSPSTINTYGYGSGDIVVEYTIYIKNGSDFQTQKLLAMRDGTTIHSTQFAVMFSSSLLVQCDATISSGNILLRATPETGVSGSTTYKVKREVM